MKKKGCAYLSGYCQLATRVLGPLSRSHRSILQMSCKYSKRRVKLCLRKSQIVIYLQTGRFTKDLSAISQLETCSTTDYEEAICGYFKKTGLLKGDMHCS